MYAKRFGLVLALLTMAVAPVFAGKVMIVADEWPQMDVFEKFLNQNGFTAEKYEQKDMPKQLGAYDACIEFIHGAMADETAAALIDYANGGGRLVVLHHGVSSKKKATKGWYQFLGMDLDQSKDAENPYSWIHGVDLTFVNLQPHHYVTSHNVKYAETVEYKSSDQPSPVQKLPAITFHDTEVFINHQFTDGREKNVLFGYIFHNRETGETIMQDRSGWYKPAGKGWLFYFQPGHSVTDLENPNYSQIVLNAITWNPGD
ncbi:MAG: hypothetical protein GC154_18745 [bacterium]|nr:hypothetical protein [bacterium]